MDAFDKMKNLEYVTGDLESPLATVKMDVLNIPFEANTFDVVFCNHVMEHVESDIKAMKEILRVLKPNGWAIMQSPVYPELEQTLEDPSITDPLERERIYGQNDHLRKFGRDYGLRIEKAGFRVTEIDYLSELSDYDRKRYALPQDEIIYFCEKA
jgi:ubiquinone/menaquinone biosynthesis C-methylase UbiE